MHLNAPRRSAPFSSPRSIPGIGPILGFLLGAFLFGQLYLGEMSAAESLSEQLAVAEAATVQLKEARSADDALIALLRAQAALTAARHSLVDSNFGTATDHLQQAAAHMDSALDVSADPDRLAALIDETRQTRIAVSGSRTEQLRQVDQLQITLAALTP